MRFSSLVAVRILRGGQSRNLSVVSKISVIGVSIGVATLIVVFSISVGFSSAFKEKVLSLQPHMIVQKANAFDDVGPIQDNLSTVPGVTEVLPATYDQLMIVAGQRRSQIVLKGYPVENKVFRERVRKVLATPSPNGKQLDPFALAPPFHARVEDDTVLLSKGHIGAVSELLVVENEAGAPTVRVADRGFLETSPYREHISIASPTGMTIQCSGMDENYRFLIPANGGFSPSVELLSGSYECSKEPRPGMEKPGQWVLSVNGGLTRTIVLDRNGNPIQDLDVTHDPMAIKTGSTVRVYWPNKSSFSVIGPSTKKHAVLGTDSDWVPMDGLSMPGILLGATVARKLNAETGDEVRIMSLFSGFGGTIERYNGQRASVVSFRVHGILHTGFHDFDQKFVITDLNNVLRLIRKSEQIDWLEIRIGDVSRTQAITKDLSMALDEVSLVDVVDNLSLASGRLRDMKKDDIRPFNTDKEKSALAYFQRVSQLGFVLTPTALSIIPQPEYDVIDWRRMNRPLLEAIMIQQVVLTVFFLIIILVAASNIVGNQIMLIHEKTAAISILRAMGASQRQVGNVFRIQALIMASLGTLIGTILGLILCTLLAQYPMPLDPEIYYIENLPVQPNAMAVVVVVLSTLFGTFLATHFSARRAAKLDLLKGIHRLD